jgi:hypothetical protein
MYFIKPYTSRPANSEKYLVCVDFVPCIGQEELEELLVDIPYLTRPGTMRNFAYQRYICPYQEFYMNLHSANTKLFTLQTEFIDRTLKLMDPIHLQESREELHREQIESSVHWCERYDFPINYQCKYLYYSFFGGTTK